MGCGCEAKSMREILAVPVVEGGKHEAYHEVDVSEQVLGEGRVVRQRLRHERLLRELGGLLKVAVELAYQRQELSWNILALECV